MNTMPGRICTLFVLAAGCFANAPAATSNVVNNPTCFRIFDATTYSGKPDMTQLGIESVLLVDADHWWRPDDPHNDLPRKSAIRDWVRVLPKRSDVVVLDLERWHTHDSERAMSEAIGKYSTILEWIRESGAKQSIGYYAYPPVADYWRAVQSPDSLTYREWQTENDVFAQLADRVDILFPSLYTFYDDPEGWRQYAIANLLESRRIARGKPIYPFLWPQYHNSNKNLGLKYMPGEVFARQLELVSKYADGVVIWGGGWDSTKGRPVTWDPNAAWWKATQEFVASNSKKCKR